MRGNHPRFGAQVAGRRNYRNAAGTVMTPVAARPVAAAAIAVVRLLRLAHVLRWHSSAAATGHDTVVAVVRLPAAATMLLLMVGQRYHVRWSQGLLVMVAAGRHTRMMVVSVVVVDPWSLRWHIRRWHARQMRQMGWGRWRVAHVLGRGWMSVHHPGCGYFLFWLVDHTPSRNSPLFYWLSLQ